MGAPTGSEPGDARRHSVYGIQEPWGPSPSWERVPVGFGAGRRAEPVGSEPGDGLYAVQGGGKNRGVRSRETRDGGLGARRRAPGLPADRRADGPAPDAGGPVGAVQRVGSTSDLRPIAVGAARISARAGLRSLQSSVCSK